jgi:hypothetical protein
MDGDLAADILWSDVRQFGATNNAAVVKKVKLTGSVATNDLGIIVTPGAPAAGGNSLVVLFVDGDGDGYYDTSEVIKWSWLIWNTDYSPTPGGTDPSTAIAPNGTGTWMDRNLGATTNTDGANTVYGYMYQWGRPHPLNHAIYNGNREGFYVRNNNSNPSTLSTPISGNAITGTTIETWINNPMKQFYGGGGTSGLATQDDNLWADASKTVYDPCPSGWRVPATGSWEELDFASFTDYGRIATNKGGYYPAAGSCYAGSIGSAGVRGQYWSSSTSGNNGRSINFTNSAIYPTYPNSRADGISVRCVKS